MTLPTNTTVNGGCDDDSDMFGPPRSSPPIGYHHHRSRVPMISKSLRQREERKRILQLCAHKLEHIKDSETNLRRSVCINNTYCRLTDELRREKQSRYLANLPKSDSKPESARDNIFNPYNSCGIDSSNHQPKISSSNNNPVINDCSVANDSNVSAHRSSVNNAAACSALRHDQHQRHQHDSNNNTNTSSNNNQMDSGMNMYRKRHQSSNNLDTDLEILDRELNAINAPMPLIDPEITQGAEQLEKAISSRKRSRSEDESDRLVREALSQFYIPPPQRLISAIEDCPLDVVGLGVGGMSSVSTSAKRQKMGPSGSVNDLELDFEMNHQSQKEFEVIMDALRLGTPSPTPSMGNDSCGQAAMMMSESASVFHNLVVTSLET